MTRWAGVSRWGYNAGFAVLLVFGNGILASPTTFGKLAQVGMSLVMGFGFLTAGILFQSGRGIPQKSPTVLMTAFQTFTALVAVAFFTFMVWAPDPYSKIGNGLVGGWLFFLTGLVIECYRAPKLARR